MIFANFALRSTVLLSSAFLISCTSMASSRLPQSATHQIHQFESDANGFNTKNFFYDNGEEVVVFDTQFTADLAAQSIAFIRSKTKSPITTVVITHPNPDKFNGATEFQKLGAKVVASKATAAAISGVHAYKKYYFTQIAKMFSDATYPQEARIDQTFERELDLRLRNGEVIELRELAQPGVSSTQTVAFVPTAKFLLVGDLVHHRAHAWLEGGIVNGKATPTLAGWIADLRQIAAMYPETTAVYGGRGEAAPLKTAINEQIVYLQKADQIVSDYVSHLGARKAELAGPKAAEHSAALQAQFEREFPSYGLGYMINYGVYGLANSK